MNYSHISLYSQHPLEPDAIDFRLNDKGEWTMTGARRAPLYRTLRKTARRLLMRVPVKARKFIPVLIAVVLAHPGVSLLNRHASASAMTTAITKTSVAALAAVQPDTVSTADKNKLAKLAQDNPIPDASVIGEPENPFYSYPLGGMSKEFVDRAVFAKMSENLTGKFTKFTVAAAKPTHPQQWPWVHPERIGP